MRYNIKTAWERILDQLDDRVKELGDETGVDSTTLNSTDDRLTYQMWRDAIESMMESNDAEIDEEIEDAESELRERARSALDMF